MFCLIFILIPISDSWVAMSWGPAELRDYTSDDYEIGLDWFNHCNHWHCEDMQPAGFSLQQLCTMKSHYIESSFLSLFLSKWERGWSTKYDARCTATGWIHITLSGKEQGQEMSLIKSLCWTLLLLDLATKVICISYTLCLYPSKRLKRHWVWCKV